jgi:hypothetical protein
MDLSIWQAFPDSCDADDFRESLAPNVQGASHSECPATRMVSADMQPPAAAVPQTSVNSERDAETTRVIYKGAICQV